MKHHGRDRCCEVDGINGLWEMRLESRREDTSPIFGARVAGERDRGEKTSVFGFMLPNVSDEYVPVFTREAETADQGVGALHFERLMRFSDRRHRFHAGASLRQHQ